jgi:beta-galactosidase
MRKLIWMISLVVFALISVGRAEQRDYQFAFGAGKPQRAVQQISAQDQYTAEKGFGIESSANVPTPGVTPLPPMSPSVQDSAGCITSDKPFIFSAAVPEGVYRVTVTIGDPAADCTATIKAEARRLMVENWRVAKGAIATKSFLVHVRRPEIAGTDAKVKLDPREPGSFTWDDKLSLEFLGGHIALQKIDIHKVDDAVTIFLCGDSTVTDQPIEPYGSWGQMLPRWFDDKVCVANFAESGETLKAFKLEKRWDKVSSLVKPGDYVFMQFGNNDMQTRGHNAMWPADDHEEDWENVHSDADTDYQTILEDWSAQVKAKGATPVIVAPYTKQRGGAPDPAGLRTYPQAAEKAAKDSDTPFLNLTAISTDVLESLGTQNGMLAYVDGQHTRSYGAYMNSRSVVFGIQQLKLNVAKYLADDSAFDPKKPVPLAADFAVQLEPSPARGGPPPVVPGASVKLTKIVPDGKPHKFEAKNKQFLIDGEPTLLIAGEMHFGRVLPEDFELRVKQAKAMGLNTLSFYLFWNLSEPEEGQFDFTGMNDVRRMCKLCQENGLWVILRPGPYCCAEVDYGGIPYWTAKTANADVKIRTADPKYVAWSKRYIDRLAQEIADLQVTRGGPVIMMQIENEFGMVARASGGYGYTDALYEIFKHDFDVPLFVCDPGVFGSVGGRSGYPADVLRGRNGLKSQADYNQAAAAAGDFPVYAPEVYTAWFSGWGQPIATRNATIPAIIDWSNSLLNYNASWCYYVFFGGTNWGYDTGCNEFLPLQTTYDYNAPIDEAGRITPKYRTLRELLAKRTERTLPEPPADPPVSALPAIKFTEHQPLLEMLSTKFLGEAKLHSKPISMEDLNQACGFVDYRKTFPNGIKGMLEIRDARDYAITMVNGKTVEKSFIGLGADSNKITLNESGPVTLDILVHNLGRISVITSANSQDLARKGLIGGAFLDGAELTDWHIISLPLSSVQDIKPSQTPHTGPTFYHATFNVPAPAAGHSDLPSTFLDMQKFSFGIVWVNGHNLGRFWDRGGARSLFLSGHFLKPGANDITVLELHDAPSTAEVTSTTNMIETAAVPFVMRLDTPTAGGNAPLPSGRANGLNSLPSASK